MTRTRPKLAAMAVVAAAGIVTACSAPAQAPVTPPASALPNPVASSSPTVTAGTAAVPCSQFLSDLQVLYTADQQQNGPSAVANFPITDLMTPANAMNALFGAVGYRADQSLAAYEVSFALDSGEQPDAGYLAHGIIWAPLGTDIENLSSACGVGS